jgi:hypothetical protein
MSGTWRTYRPVLIMGFPGSIFLSVIRTAFPENMPRSTYDDKSSASLSAEIYMALIRNRMAGDELPSSPYRIDLGEHTAEQVYVLLTQCVEIALRELN